MKLKFILHFYNLLDKPVMQCFSTIGISDYQALAAVITNKGDRNETAVSFFGIFWRVLGGCGNAVLASTFPNIGIEVFYNRKRLHSTKVICRGLTYELQHKTA